MAKTRKSYILQQRTKFVYTKPEVQTTALLREIGYDPKPNQKKWVFEDEEQKWYELQIDNLLELSDKPFGKIAIHTDGYVHRKQKGVRKHDRWRDRMLVKYEIRSVHLPTERLANEELKETARKDLKTAIESDERIVYIPP